MARDTSPATRRIMNQLGEERRIPLIAVSEGDLGVLLGFPLAGLLGGTLLGDVVVVPLALLGVVLGVAFVYAAPTHVTAWTWLQDVGRFYLRQPKYTLSKPADASHEGTAGSQLTYSPFVPSERTQELTSVRRAWPGVGVIEREDGCMEAFLEIEPANMDFAMSGDWARIQELCEEFANSELEFPLTMHTTTESFPTDRLTSQLDARLDDPAVTEQPAFRELITEYREQRPTELADTHQHRYYLGVEVSGLDVHQRERTTPTPAEKLTQLPIVGLAFTPFVTRRGELSDAERRQAMFETLDGRIRTVRTELVESVPGWSARRCSTLELVCRSAGFWNGAEYDEAERLLRTEPAVGSTTTRRDA